jgi:hypothetical protein
VTISDCKAAAPSRAGYVPAMQAMVHSHLKAD